jgi:hypothetical protein
MKEKAQTKRTTVDCMLYIYMEGHRRRTNPIPQQIRGAVEGAVGGKYRKHIPSNEKKAFVGPGKKTCALLLM